MQPFLNIFSITVLMVSVFILASAVFFFLSVRMLYKILKVTRSITEEQKIMAQVFFPNVKIHEAKEGQPRTGGMGEVKLGFTWDDNAEGRG